MAPLPDADRFKIFTGLMRYISSIGQVLPLNKADLRAAVDATDTWIDDNQASYNAAIPQPARDRLTLAQKTLLFCAVAAFRVSQEFAERLLGSVE